jgi:hypothetical protein
MLHIKQFHWSQLARVQIPSLDCVCTSCAPTGKPILRPSHHKIKDGPLQFLKLIQGDMCVLPTIVWTILGIFMVFIDASTRWSCVCLMSTWNHAFTTIMRKVIKLHAHYLESWILSICMDNDVEFSSCGFNDLHGLGDWSSTPCPIHPYSKWFD